MPNAGVTPSRPPGSAAAARRGPATTTPGVHPEQLITSSQSGQTSVAGSYDRGSRGRNRSSGPPPWLPERVCAPLRVAATGSRGVSSASPFGHVVEVRVVAEEDSGPLPLRQAAPRAARHPAQGGRFVAGLFLEVSCWVSRHVGTITLARCRRTQAFGPRAERSTLAARFTNTSCTASHARPRHRHARRDTARRRSGSGTALPARPFAPRRPITPM